MNRSPTPRWSCVAPEIGRALRVRLQPGAGHVAVQPVRSSADRALTTLRVSLAPVVRVAVCLGVVMTCPMSAARAQEVPSVEEERLRDVLMALPQSETLQISTPRVIIDNARLVSLEASTVELREEATGIPVSIDFSAVRGVAVQRRHWLQGTVWGFSGGVLAGSFFGMMLGSYRCTSVELCRASERAGALRLGALVGALGGGIGFTFGRRALYWKPIFP